MSEAMSVWRDAKVRMTCWINLHFCSHCDTEPKESWFPQNKIYITSPISENYQFYWKEQEAFYHEWIFTVSFIHIKFMFLRVIPEELV